MTDNNDVHNQNDRKTVKVKSKFQKNVGNDVWFTVRQTHFHPV